jgi:phospholipase/carboxylesterase
MPDVIPLDTSAAVWSAPVEKRAGKPIVVMMHGYYGNELDWSAHFDRLPEGVVGVSLRAPIAVGERWAWVDFNKNGSVDLPASRRGVRAWLDTLDTTSIALMGWSQGGAMALHLLRQDPRRFEFAVSVGGFAWDTRPIRRVADARPPVFFGRGAEDDVIPPSFTRRSLEWLRTHTDLTEHVYPGVGHELDDRMLDDAFAFVSRQSG